jgi:hypothetical protein
LEGKRTIISGRPPAQSVISLFPLRGMTPAGGSHGNPYSTSRVPHAVRQHSSRVAVRGGRSATSETPDHRVNGPWHGFNPRPRLVRRLRELGWIEGGNIGIEYQWAAGSGDRFAEIAADFAQRKVDVIATSATGPTLAAKQATSTIPIVFAGVGDAVGSGIVANLARPGANILTNVGNPSAMLEVHEVEATVRSLGLESVTRGAASRGYHSRVRIF